MTKKCELVHVLSIYLTYLFYKSIYQFRERDDIKKAATVRREEAQDCEESKREIFKEHEDCFGSV